MDLRLHSASCDSISIVEIGADSTDYYLRSFKCLDEIREELKRAKKKRVT